ncbi:MAG: signal peptidase I, partial [Sulfobacillus thermosulfidooxidans]
MTKERRKGYWEVIETIVIAVVLAFLIRT